MRLIFAAVCFFWLLISPVLAWSDAGHKIIASIAFQRLNPPEQARVVEILRQHPRFADDFTTRMPEDLQAADEPSRNEWLFQQAAVWSDMARGFPEAARLKFHRGPWHYINVPHFLTDADRTAMDGHLEINLKLAAPRVSEEHQNVIQTIRMARTVLNDSQAAPADKALMLAWLFHTVGDIHQPLHSTALFSRKLFPEGDRGGNLVLTGQRQNLHAVWDQFPGQRVEFKTGRDRATGLMHDSAMKDIGVRAARQLNEQTWMDESHRLAVAQVYNTEVLGHLRQFVNRDGNEKLPAISLSDEYLKAGGKVSEERVVQAGYRLGAILKEIVN